jgi:hypothetical protein
MCLGRGEDGTFNQLLEDAYEEAGTAADDVDDIAEKFRALRCYFTDGLAMLSVQSPNLPRSNISSNRFAA